MPRSFRIPSSPTAVGAPGNIWHQFNPTNPAIAAQCAAASGAGQACLKASFRDSGNAMGIGDVVLRGKYTRPPMGASGTRRRGRRQASYRRRNELFGFRRGGREAFWRLLLQGTRFAARRSWLRNKRRLHSGWKQPGSFGAAPVAKGSLPNRFVYIVGADVVVTKRLTGAFDIYGQTIVQRSAAHFPTLYRLWELLRCDQCRRR